MGYVYENERPKLFTEEGTRMLVAISIEAARLFKLAGAARFQEMTRTVSGDSWLMLAATDYLVEMGRISRVSSGTAGQHQVFVSGVSDGY
jgi:hypothetical protein